MNYFEQTQQQREQLMARNPMPTQDLLYHYTGRVDDENLRRIIASELFYFSNPKHFNDALDVMMPVQAIKTGEQNPEMPIIATRADGTTGETNVFTDHSPELAKALAQILPEFQDESTDKLRVLCLTESNKNNLMWAHYANRHTGICIGLEWKKFTSHPPHKVLYQDEMSLTEFNSSRFEWEVHPRARTKTPDWSYEQEWRVFSSARNSDEMVFECLVGAVKSIVLGSQVTRQTQLKVIEIVARNNPKVEVLQADFIDGGLFPSKIEIADDFLEISENKLREKFWGEFNRLFEIGDIDGFLETLSPYFHHFNEFCELHFCWDAIITASRLTTNAVLKNRVRRWCPLELADRTKDAQRGRIKLDVFYVWQAYLSPFQKNGRQDLWLVSNCPIDSLSEENKRLFLTLGWCLATAIEKDNEHFLHGEFKTLCESNLKIAKELSNEHDVAVCESMLARVTLI
jgi:hypothetical protein